LQKAQGTCEKARASLYCAHDVRKTRAQIIQALKANPNGLAVAQQFGVSSPVIYKIAKKAKIALGRGGKPTWPIEKIPEIIKALKANPNGLAVAQQFDGVPVSAVYRLAKKENIRLGQPKWLIEKIPEIIKALKAKHSYGLSVGKKREHKTG
jgi:hypothetical protein